MKPLRVSSNDKRHRILKAATQLFLRHAYSATTMDAIALRARVTKQTVYSHFHDKDTLFVEMIAALCRKHAPSQALLDARDKDIETLLFEVGLAMLDLMTQPEVLAATRLVISESERRPQLAQLYYDSGTQALVQMLSEFLTIQNTRGLSHIPDTQSAASYFLSILKGQYYLRTLLHLKPVPDEATKLAHVQETVRIFMRLYGSDNPMETHSIL